MSKKAQNVGRRPYIPLCSIPSSSVAGLLGETCFSIARHGIVAAHEKPKVFSSIDGASPHVQDASSIGADAPRYRQRCKSLNYELIAS